MATSVSMQSPIPNYANFGAQVSQNVNAARERALKDTLNQREMDLKNRQFDLKKKEYDFQVGYRQQVGDILGYRLGEEVEKEKTQRDYMESIDEGGKYRRGLLGRFFKGGQPTLEEYRDWEGIKPSHPSDIYDSGIIDDQYLDPGLLNLIRTPQTSSISSSDSELMSVLLGGR